MTVDPLQLYIYMGLMDCSVTTQVRFERVLTGSAKLSHCLNLRPDRRFGSCIGLNLGPDFGQVRKSSGSNFGSGPNCGITSIKCCCGKTAPILESWEVLSMCGGSSI